MSDPFIGEIRCFGFNFNPRGWTSCNGQLLPIAQNTALFSILGTTYGGNGTTNFGLPDLRGRVPIHAGNGAGLTPVQLGEQSGSESITLQTSEMPSHSHTFSGTTASADDKRPTAGSVFATAAAGAYYAAPGAGLTAIKPTTVAAAGGSLAHNNMQPYLALNWCICMHGVFPARN